MTGPVCIGEPISWLRLERLALGELPAGEREAVEAHLAVCAVCALCRAEIARPLALQPLALQRPPAPQVSPVRRRDSFWRRARRGLFGVGTRDAFTRLLSAGAAAAIALFLFGRPGVGPDRRAALSLPLPRLEGIKGGDVTLGLVRERLGSVQHDPLTFAPADRWKVLVTCASARVLFWDLAVEEGTTMTFPLSPTAPIACGNSVPLPGAFRLSARAPVRICLLLADNPLDRSQIGRMVPSPPPEIACATLLPEVGTRSAFNK